MDGAVGELQPLQRRPHLGLAGLFALGFEHEAVAAAEINAEIAGPAHGEKGTQTEGGDDRDDERGFALAEEIDVRFADQIGHGDFPEKVELEEPEEEVPRDDERGEHGGDDAEPVACQKRMAAVMSVVTCESKIAEKALS